jgi:hypothetical protein
MILDFLTLNTTGILLCTVLLNIFYLSNKKISYILIIDIILNGIPFITIIIILIYHLNKFIFKYFNNNFINKFIFIIIYYFLFNIILYSIFNSFSMYIIKKSLKYLIYNTIIYYLGLKYYEEKYNIKR